jgi:hypothetical protein
VNVFSLRRDQLLNRLKAMSGFQEKEGKNETGAGRNGMGEKDEEKDRGGDVQKGNR